MVSTRIRLLAAMSVAAVAVGIVAAAAPANALTFDNEPVRVTAHFTVAGKPYTLRDVSLGSATQTIHVGQHSGQVRSHYRLTLRSSTGRVLARVERGLVEQAYVYETFNDAAFTTVAAFEKAEHRALTVRAATAKAHYLKGLRIESVSADLESNIDATIDYLQALPEGIAPDFSAVRTVHSNEYRGDVTVSGTDAEHWSVIVRDRQDGSGEFYDDASGSGATFRF